MKKLMLFAAAAVFSLTNVNAQETTFGALAGLSIQSLTVDIGGIGSVSDSETGFHIGGFANIGISDQFSVQPEVTYAMAGDFSMISVNAIAKYAVSDEFNVQLGPQIGFAGGDAFDAFDKSTDGDSTSMNLQLAAGVGYDINENIFVQARYGFQLNDHFTGDGDFSWKVNTISLGVGYKFGG
ncbi:porin family protein [Psychroserpens ponticola]|uniref:Porin family protein n=1 Tax=Psychroserpens ponticola TaxID=2932268 RepID=A0ABY7S122_9FLAO|nr:porin family protein [Psychroserpens ponticola]WCO03027.1 porin family protein [Psychroserpens ponticola]